MHVKHSGVKPFVSKPLQTAILTVLLTLIGACAAPPKVEPPKVVGAASLSNTSFEVAFSKAVGAEAAIVANYALSPALTISSAALSSDKTKVTLTTAAQSNLQYTVSVSGIKDQSGNALDTSAKTTTFTGIADLLKVVGAASLSNTSLEVAFSKALSSEALTATNYAISPDLAVSAVVLSADKTKATLTTAPQSKVQYTVTVSNIKDQVGNPLDPASKSTTLTGTPDIAKVIGAASLSNTSLEVAFSKAVSPEAAVAANYAIAPPLAVSVAVLSADKTKVTLTTASQSSLQYTVTVANLKDSVGNEVDPDGKSISFIGTGLVDLPKVLSATSLSNTSIEVAFSKPLSAEALIAANYAVVPSLAVTKVAINSDKTKVTLTTAKQEDIQYMVTVSGIKDLAGNALDPLSKSATFDGIPFVEGPKVVAAASLSNSTLEVNFSKSVGPEAGVAVNYSVSPALAVSDAVLNADHTRATLTTAAQSSIQYTVTVSGVKDLSGTAMEASAKSATFTGTSPSGTPGDSDGDGLSNAEEAAGWDVEIRKGDNPFSSRHVSSDPGLPDSDGDGISDRDERQNLTDPRTADTDQDGLSDFDEMGKWGSTPTDVDSDKDARSNPALFDGNELKTYGTSPTLADTDGDKISDYDEIVVRGGAFHPLIANVPQIELSLEGTTDLGVNVRYSATDSRSREARLSLSDSSTTSSSRTDTQSLRVEASVSATVETEVEAGTEGISATASQSVTVSTGFSHENTRSYSSESSRSSERTSEQAAVEASESGRSIENGRIGIGFRVRNAGDISFRLDNLSITALYRDPANPSQFKTITTLPTVSAGGIVLASDTQTGVLSAKDEQIAPNVALDIMAHPNNLFFQFAAYNLTDDEGRNFAFLRENTNSQTALLVIDYGNGHIKRMRVATNVERQNGNIVGVTVKKVLADILKLPYTSEVKQGGAKVLTSLYDQQAGQAIARNPAYHALWAVIGSSNLSIPAGTHFEDILLKPGTELHLLYLQDRDNDGLLASEEYFYSLDDNNPDFDGDGLKDGEDVEEGWTVKVVGKDERKVRSKPSVADFDKDGLNDSQEKQKGTDPNKADTDGDVNHDDKDPMPLYAKVKGQTFSARHGSLAIASGGAVVGWGGAEVPSSPGNVISVSVGSGFSLALKSDGMMVSAGSSYHCGLFNFPSGLSNVVGIAAGYCHSLALKADGTVVGWGAPAPWEDGGQQNPPSWLNNVVAVAVGGFHSLALRADGTVVAWGVNDKQPTDVPPGLSNVIAISAGFYQSLALKSDGTVVAWGAKNLVPGVEDFGQGTVPASLNGAKVVAIAAGHSHNLALKADGTVVAWGKTTEGQTTIPSGLNNVVAIEAGAHHNLALKSDGTMVAWGFSAGGLTTIPAGLVVRP